MRKLLLAAAVAIAIVQGGAAKASPVGVTYSVSGSPGDWVLDFSVTNNLVAGQGVYFFGVQASQHDLIGIPAGFMADGVWNSNYLYGGSHTTYNNVWITVAGSGTGGGIAFGDTLSGFEVEITDVAAPTSVQWFAYGDGSPYTGGGNFGSSTNPGFEGVVSLASDTSSPVPEPASLALLGTGLLGLGAARRRRARAP